MSDFLLGLLFWLLFEVLSWPLRLALAPLPMRSDLRRILSRVAGPLAIAFPLWLAAHFGLKLCPVATWIAFGIALALGLAVWRGSPAARRPPLLSLLLPLGPGRWNRAELLVEALSLGLFFGYLAVIRLAPDMNFAQANNGSEKFTNAMLFWSCWHADTLPPQDYWLAGVPQVYYYFGHFFWAWIGRAGGFPAIVVIPLALSRVVLLVWESCYLLARAMGLRTRAAAFGALLMAWGGNPEAIISAGAQALHIDRGTFMAPEALPEWHAPEWNFAGYHYWDSARVLNGVINEVPAWTAVHGEFHSHHLALPWMLGFFAVLIGGDRWFGIRRRGGWGPFLAAGVLALLAFCAVLSSLWLLPLVALGALGLFLWRRGASPAAALYPWTVAVGLALALVALMALIGGGLPSPPPDPHPLETGLRAVFARSPIRILGWMQRSTLSQLARHWGFHFALIFAASAAALVTRRPTTTQIRLAATAALLLGLQVFLLRGDSYLIWFAVAALIGLLAFGDSAWLPRRPAIYLAVAAALLGGMEIYYIRDGNPIYVRVNTYFKLSLPLWPLLTAGAWMLALRLARAPSSPAARSSVRLGLALLLPAVFALPLLGLPARTLQARMGDKTTRRASLDAFAWLHNRTGYEADAQMLDFIRSSVGPKLTVIEYAAPIEFDPDGGHMRSQAGSYDYFGRVASLAGRAVPLGWPHHEFQWRGAAVDPLIRERHDAIQALYAATDSGQVHRAAMQLGSTWVVLGKVERDHLGEARFGELRELLGVTGHLRGAFPEAEPRSFIFELH